MRQEIRLVKKVMQYFAAKSKSLFIVFDQYVIVFFCKKANEKTK